jgi:uncharacterized lipoprotein YddW (UPF0748 family)
LAKTSSRGCASSLIWVPPIPHRNVLLIALLLALCRGAAWGEGVLAVSRGAARGEGVPASDAAGAGRGAPATNNEIRALWVQRGSLTSAAGIAALVEAAKETGFNTLLVQARGRGDAYYVSKLEPRGPALAAQNPSFDPLALVITAGHRAGLRVHAWVNVNLVADAELPAARTHIVYAHPEWLMVPRELAGDAAHMDPRSPGYAAMLSRYARANSERIEGLYLSAIQPAAADYTVSVIADIAERYAVDGIHLDYARFPNDDFDYSPGALAQFLAEVRPHLSSAERREYKERSKGRPEFYTQMFPVRWQDFRRARVTGLVSKLRAAVKRERPDAVLSAAVWPDANEASTRRLQDWRGWLESGLLDVICPMAYTDDASTFRAQIAAVKQVAGRRPVWAGIGAYRLSPAQAVANIEAARRLGVEGISLFSYDNLTPQANTDPQYLLKVAQGAFAP